MLLKRRAIKRVAETINPFKEGTRKLKKGFKWQDGKVVQVSTGKVVA